MKKALLFTIIAVIVLLAGFSTLNAYIYSEKQGDGQIEQYRGMLAGEVVCLPHANTSGPQTMECAYGLKTDVGEYYALDFSLMSEEQLPVQTGTYITADGLFTPLESVSSDHWKKYAIEGIFSVTDWVLVE